MPRYFYPGTTKSTVESATSLPMSSLKRLGYIETGYTKCGPITFWRNGEKVGSIWVMTDCGSSPSITFRYTSTDWEGEKHHLDYKFPLSKRPCNFGGYRWYFICGLSRDGKMCGRRVTTLYQIDRYYGCRHCGDLTYSSRNDSKRFRGYKRLLDRALGSADAEEFYRTKVKREYYNGKPTRNYRRYLKMAGGQATKLDLLLLDRLLAKK